MYAPAARASLVHARAPPVPLCTHRTPRTRAPGALHHTRTLATPAPAQDDIPQCTKPPRYGQPTPDTHPHLMRPGELTPGIPREEYHARRTRLMDSLPDGTVALALGGKVKYMSQGIFYKFRQASDFWYLTGFDEPDSAVILEKTSDTKGYRMTLFLRPKDAQLELWEGACTGVDAALTLFSADSAYAMSALPAHLRSLLSAPSTQHIYVDGSLSPKGRAKKGLFDFLKGGGKTEYDGILSGARGRIHELAPEVGRLRAIKSENEQAVMRRAGALSGRAHAKTMAFTRSAQTEAQLAAHFEYQCALAGAQRPAYVPVVASGANARIIHYVNNDCTLRPGEMVLMDGGAEYNGYASDITRTWPVSGTFTPPQRDLYSAVLAVEKACIGLCTGSAQLSLADLHRRSCELLREELTQIGFRFGRGGGGAGGRELEGTLYPHFLSHPIGIDLHESATIDRGERLRPGMVITVEPGVYVPPHDSFPKHFHNLGVRIEDCVLVQQEHSVVLSVEAPKEVEDVEGACQRSLAPV
ncbi:peptidase M24 [Calocera cornea HHB12733]|uniref:Peptidase M24 n=1 Tax=Calocera cornea HHB12733 TaxID=1353952 RepID=A0A165DRF6_9BASI|nr:peptidase M24 [Calocera cornea HHB12733]